ncbi:MAG TPA: dipeptidase [Candidatus Hydrogenedentes bacterium]|nr:dipeptidase [Candidatus Hydrogenedentota bacterium]
MKTQCSTNLADSRPGVPRPSFLAYLWLRMVNRTLMRKPYRVRPEAETAHQKMTVVDMHCDALLSNRDLLVWGRRGHVDLPRLRKGNIALQFFSIPTLAPVRAGIPWIPLELDAMTYLLAVERWPKKALGSTFERVMHAADMLRDLEARSEGLFHIIQSVPQLDAFLAAREENPNLTAGLLGVEGLHSLEGRLENLDAFYDAGVRTAGLVHLGGNDLGGSAHGRQQGGLTPFGEVVLRRMEEKRMLVDLAHASPALIDDILDRATRPVFISHTGLKGAHDNERNISDAQAGRIAEKGGVIGIAFFPWAIGPCTVQSIVRSVLYAVNLVGADHVGLGSDWDGMVATPFDASGVALLTDALLRHGLSEEDAAKIMGGNAIRVVRETLPEE